MDLGTCDFRNRSQNRGTRMRKNGRRKTTLNGVTGVTRKKETFVTEETVKAGTRNSVTRTRRSVGGRMTGTVESIAGRRKRQLVKMLTEIGGEEDRRSRRRKKGSEFQFLNLSAISFVFDLNSISSIHSFLHSGYLYSTPSRKLLRGVLRPASAKENV